MREMEGWYMYIKYEQHSSISLSYGYIHGTTAPSWKRDEFESGGGRRLDPPSTCTFDFLFLETLAY